MILGTIAIWFLWAVMIGVPGAIIGYFFWGFVCEPWRERRDFSQVGWWLERLLRRGFDRAHLVISHAKTGCAIRFEKYILQDQVSGIAQYGIALTIPGSDHSKRYESWLQNYCEAQGGALSTQETEEDGFRVDFGHETDKAAEAAKAIWTDFFGLSPGAPHETVEHDVLEYDALVDRRDYPRPTRAETVEHLLRESREQWRKLKQVTGDCLSGMEVLVGTFLVVGFLVSSIGLSAATLLAVDSPTNWSLQIGSVVLRGSDASLVFLGVYLLSCAGLILENVRHPSPRLTGGRLVFVRVKLEMTIVLPFAVLLVWADA